MPQEWSDIDIEKIANGDAQEWKRLVDCYNQVLTRHAYNITHDTQSANDIAQMVLLNLWEHRSTVVDIKSLGAYLIRAARNKALTYIRDRSREVSYSSDIAMLTPGQKVNGPETVLQREEFAEVILIRIEQLTPKQRKVIEHILAQPDISTRELGKILGCSHKNVQAILKRIREQFQKVQKLLGE